MKWCFSCAEPDIPDIDINMTCRSACCVSKTSDVDIDMHTDNQAKDQSKKTKNKKKHVRTRQEEKTE